MQCKLGQKGRLKFISFPNRSKGALQSIWLHVEKGQLFYNPVICVMMYLCRKSAGGLSDLGIEPKSLLSLALAGGLCTPEPPGKPINVEKGRRNQSNQPVSKMEREVSQTVKWALQHGLRVPGWHSFALPIKHPNSWGRQSYPRSQSMCFGISWWHMTYTVQTFLQAEPRIPTPFP